MLRVEVDMFSGRPNPVWVVTDARVTKDFLSAVGGKEGITAKQGAGFTGLGFREVQVEIMDDDEPRRKGVPKQFALASTAVANLKSSAALARRLIETMPLGSEVKLVQHAVTPLTQQLRDMMLVRLASFVTDPPRPRRHNPRLNPADPLRTTVVDTLCEKCQYEVSQFNPAFWNDPAVQPHNNCYNYARDWRTDTFAQPGRAHGAESSTMACDTITTAAMADGFLKRCNCLPQSQYPRRLIALAMDPGYDYHWYRQQRGGFWGHKPGATKARNFDNSNAVIVNPETCDRGGYTDFCGYFYAGLSVVIN